MALNTVADLIDVLREHHLLRPAQLTVLSKQIAEAITDPGKAADELVQRKWLTGFQRDRVLGGQPERLVVGPYVLLESIGVGGMGEVFKARHRVIDRIVALKVIRQESLARDERAVARFQREARAAAQLFHPNVVLLYDADRVDDTYYIAMQFIDGLDLAEMVKQQGPLPVVQACDFIRQAAVGLQHAHEHGIIHRDIKPSNLLVAGTNPDPSSQTLKEQSTVADSAEPGMRPRLAPPREATVGSVVKILDLGVIRFAEEHREQTKDASLTQEGTMVGTPDFMAPEQARNSRSVDGRTDIYALGGTFYFLLTGKVPFPDGTAMEKLLHHQLDEPEPIEKIRPEVPTPVTTIVRKMMAKLANDRFASAAEIVQVLDRLLISLAGPIEITRQESPKSARTERPAPERAESAGSLPPVERSPDRPRVTLPEIRPEEPRPTVSGARAEQPWATPPAPPAVQAHRTPPPERAEGPRPGPPARPAEPKRSAPDSPAPPLLQNTFVDIPAMPPENAEPPKGQTRPLASSLYHWQAGTDAPGDVVAAEPVKPISIQKGHQGCTMSLAFALHRDTLASGGVDGAVRLWDFSGKRPRPLAVMKVHQQAVHSLAFAADHVTLASGSGSMDGQIWIWNVTSDSVKEKALFEGHACPIDALAFSPNGAVLASGGNDATVRIWDLGGTEPGQRRVLKGHRHGVKTLAFSADGQHLASGSMDGTVRLWGLDRWWSKERAVLEEHGGHVYALAFAPQGKWLASGGQDQDIILWDLTTASPQPKHVLKGHHTSVRKMVFTPDGQFLVSVGDGGRVIQWDVASATKARAWQLSTVLISSYDFTFDGRYVAAGTTDGPVRIYRLGQKRRPGLLPESGSLDLPFFE